MAAGAAEATRPEAFALERPSFSAQSNCYGDPKVGGCSGTASAPRSPCDLEKPLVLVYSAPPRTSRE